MTTATTSQPSLDADFINAFLSATTNTFKMVTNVDVAFAGAQALPRFYQTEGMLSLIECKNMQQGQTHLVCICYPQPFLDKVSTPLFGNTNRQVTRKQYKDALGELANIISGNAVTHLSGSSTECKYDISPPKCLNNTNLLGHVFSGRDAFLVLTFEAESVPFYLQIVK